MLKYSNAAKREKNWRFILYSSWQRYYDLSMLKAWSWTQKNCVAQRNWPVGAVWSIIRLFKCILGAFWFYFAILRTLFHENIEKKSRKIWIFKPSLPEKSGKYFLNIWSRAWRMKKRTFSLNIVFVPHLIGIFHIFLILLDFPKGKVGKIL